MQMEKTVTSDSTGGYVEKTSASTETMSAGGTFYVQCFDADGTLKWEDAAKNLVVNTGLQDMNNRYFAGSGYTAAWYLGLVTGPGANNTYSATDTLGTHTGWVENTAYSGNRKACSFGAATLADPSNINNASSAASFTMTGNATIAGAFLANVATGNAGVLFSVSNFVAPGDRTVVSGDVLNVTYQFNLDAA